MRPGVLECSFKDLAVAPSKQREHRLPPAVVLHATAPSSTATGLPGPPSGLVARVHLQALLDLRHGHLQGDDVGPQNPKGGSEPAEDGGGPKRVRTSPVPWCLTHRSAFFFSRFMDAFPIDFSTDGWIHIQCSMALTTQSLRRRQMSTVDAPNQ